MGGLLDCAKSRQLKLNQQEKAIFECKRTRDKIKDYIKSLQRNEQIKREKAKEALKGQNKERAKLFLKQSKLYHEQINSATGQLNIIEEQITQIETAQHQKEILKVLEQGNKVLKSLTEEVNVERLERITDDLSDLKQQQDEVANFFKNHGIDQNQYEEEVDKELEQLMKLQNGELELALPIANKKNVDIDFKESENYLSSKYDERLLIKD